ncbi:hypothetical protein [Rhodobacter sp. CZR27]|uniref:hypothetical protein n=1 Tax=Rhodobacter sp. CZR27 TaxID=2033869 RepID=UPI000BBE89F8|nr:hypothetical protein [Rhodobacter sp. CZR27]
MYTVQHIVTIQNVIAATLVVWYFAAVYYLELRRQFRYPEYPRSARFPMWRKRFQLYAQLQATSPGNITDRSPEAQEVLQAFLRKVEIRSATLVALWAVVLGAVLTLAFTLPSWQVGRLLLIAIAVCCIPFVLRLALGVAQVDQVAAQKVLTNSVDDATAARRLQDQLIEDLFNKELAFRFSAFGFRSLLAVLLLLTAGYLSTYIDWAAVSANLPELTMPRFSLPELTLPKLPAFHL